MTFKETRREYEDNSRLTKTDKVQLQKQIKEKSKVEKTNDFHLK